MADRQELIQNALAFLGDPNTRNYPLTQRIAFLESKGLTPAEIEGVMQQAGGGTPVSGPVPSSSVPATKVQGSLPYGFGPVPSTSYGPRHTLAPPSIPQRDWRDYFIMAVVSGGFLFGVASFARKYLLPHLQPPSATAYEADQLALTAQFDEIAKLVTSIESDTSSQRTLLDEQREKVDGALDKLQIAIRETKDAEARTKADLREIREEVNNVRDMLPKMLEKNKDAQSQALLDLQAELKSLKTLLLSRSPGMSSLYGSTSPSLAGLPGGTTPPILPRPTIPAWQLSSSSPTSSSYVTKTKPDDVSTVIPTAQDKGKGKEKEITSEPLASSGVLISEAVSDDDSVIAS